MAPPAGPGQVNLQPPEAFFYPDVPSRVHESAEATQARAQAITDRIARVVRGRMADLIGQPVGQVEEEPKKAKKTRTKAPKIEKPKRIIEP